MKLLLLQLHFVIGLIVGCSPTVYAQEAMPPDNYNYHIIVEKFYREHIPLDCKETHIIPFRKDSLFGFVDRVSQKQILAPKYRQVFASYGEGAIVSLDNEHYGFVDYEGNEVVGCYFENMFRNKDLLHGLITATDTSRKDPRNATYIYNFFYNLKTKERFLVKAHDQGEFEDNDYAWFRFDRVYSIYDRKGKEVYTFPQKREEHFVGIFDNELVFEMKNAKDKNYTSTITVKSITGKPLYSLQQNLIYGLKGFRKYNDTLLALVDEGNVQFVNHQGKVLPFYLNSGTVGFGFYHAYNSLLSNELIKVYSSENDKDVAILRKDGKLLTNFTQQFLSDPVGNEFPFTDTITHKIGFKNKEGDVVVPAKISAQYFISFGKDLELDERIFYGNNLCRITQFKTDKEGTITISDDGTPKQYGYLNRLGDIAFWLPDSVTWAGHFSDGRAPVLNQKNELGFIDTTGKLVIQYKYELAVAGAYPMPYIVIPEFKNGVAYLKAFKAYIDKNGVEYFSGKKLKDKYDFSH
jgi:hypothetical protein